MNIFKSFSVYLVATFLQGGISFLVLPIFTFYLSTSDFGMLSLITSLFVFISPVITLGTTNAISIAYFNENKQNYASYVTSSMLIPLLLSVFLFLLCVIFGNYFSTILGIPKIWLMVIPIFSFMSIIHQIILIDYQVKEEPFNYGLFSLSNTTLNIGLSLFLVIVLGMNYEGRLLGQYFSILIFSIFALILLNKRGVLTSKISKKFLKDALIFGLPIVPHVIGGMVINMSDKIFISQILGKSELGVYNMGYVIGAAISMLSIAFANSIVPISYSLFNKGDNLSKEKVVKIYWMFIIALALIVLLITILAPFIFDLFINKQFKKGVIYVKWISLGYFFHGCYLLFVNIIYYVKKTNILFYWSIVNIVVNLLLNYLMINKYGAIGAAYTLCISYFLFFLAMSIISSKLYPLPWFYFLKKRLVNF